MRHARILMVLRASAPSECERGVTFRNERHARILIVLRASASSERFRRPATTTKAGGPSCLASLLAIASALSLPACGPALITHLGQFIFRLVGGSQHQPATYDNRQAADHALPEILHGPTRQLRRQTLQLDDAVEPLQDHPAVCVIQALPTNAFQNRHRRHGLRPAHWL